MTPAVQDFLDNKTGLKLIKGLGDNLEVLVTERTMCQTSVITILEDALAAAKNGDFIAIGLAVVSVDGGVDIGFSQSDSVEKLYAAAGMLKRHFEDVLMQTHD